MTKTAKNLRQIERLTANIETVAQRMRDAYAAGRAQLGLGDTAKPTAAYRAMTRDLAKLTAARVDVTKALLKSGVRPGVIREHIGCV
jgi:hypothetical protein